MAVYLEKNDGVARVIIDRPPVNVLDIQTMSEINEALADIQKDSSINVVVIEGKGKAFSAGVDIKDHTVDKVKDMVDTFHKMFHILVDLPQPTIAVVKGSTLGGGCELALFCDFVIAADNTKLGQPEIKVGVYPPIAAFILPRLIGRKKALELVLTGDVIDANEAYRLGLVNQVVPEDKLEEATSKFVSKLAGLSGAVVKLTKRALYLGLDGDFKQVLGKIEDIYLNEVMKTEDAVEGLTAFLEKRAPVWKNK